MTRSSCLGHDIIKMPPRRSSRLGHDTNFIFDATAKVFLPWTWHYSNATAKVFLPWTWQKFLFNATAKVFPPWTWHKFSIWCHRKGLPTLDMTLVKMPPRRSSRLEHDIKILIWCHRKGLPALDMTPKLLLWCHRKGLPALDMALLKCHRKDFYLGHDN